MTEVLARQADYAMKELTELSTKFQGHYMTKLNKQLKAEKEQLEKQNHELSDQVKLLLSDN
jgi:gamma-glutamyl phosphate reductase